MRYIDADAFLKWCGENLKQSVLNTQIQRWIDMQPTADVKPVVRGEWHTIDWCANEGVYCSVCNKKVYKVDYSNTMKLHSNFCPHCGTDMRGEKE